MKELIKKADRAWKDEKIGEEGFKTISENYAWRTVVQKIDKVYEGLTK